MAETFCYHCGARLSLPLYRSSLCPACAREARVCLNCTFYEPGRQYDCREHIPEPVAEKDRANFCDYFRPGAGKGAGASTGDQSASRKAFEDLFS
jgi:hypothetical protein